MTSPDLKKLIAGFLVLSAITSVVTLISLNLSGKASPSEQSLQIEGESGNNPLSTIGKNAFVEKLPESGRQASAQSAGGSNAAVLSNLTKNFAGVFAGQMLANNPNGPQTDQNGNPTVLNLPGEDKATEMIKEALSKTSIAFDDKLSVPVNKIAKSFTPDDVSEYLNKVYEIIGQVSSSTKSSANSAQNQTADGLILPALAIESAVAKLSSLSVPQPFVALHTTLLRFFSNQKTVFNSVTNYQADPMKAIVALQNEKEIINRDLARIKSAASKIDLSAQAGQKALSSGNIPEWQKLYSEIFGVKKAYAIFGIGDIVFDPSNFGNTLASVGAAISNNLGRISEWLYTTALRIAVNIMINEFQNQVVNWIAGNGNPKFITDWNGFLSDVANKAIGQTVYNILPQACTGLGPLLRVSLLPVPRANTGVQCTLSQISNNLDNFMNRFRNGSWYVFGGYNSWNAYASVLQPNNNYFGSLIVAQDRATLEAITAQEAAKNQAIASQGFLSVDRTVGCSRYVPDEDGDPTTTCEPGYEIKVATTPGAVVGETLTTSLGWKGNQIIKAERFEELVAAIVNASINRVMREGLSSLTEAMNPPRPSFAGATPTGIINPSSLGNTTNNVNSLIASLNQAGASQNNQAIIDADRQWLALKPQVVTELNQLINTCFDLSNDISQRIAELNSMATTTQAEFNNANVVRNAINTASTATSTQDISDALNAIQTINVIQIRDAAAAAQERLGALQDIQTAARAGSTDNNCPRVIPSATSRTQNSTDTGE
ncbi:MAG: hypothetical protein A3B13_01320 [Candidatus Liptonbacteria bacterium RIFCSPLOWO2_01_FULL_45_15]|uniref:Uncharacterized protein n=1 Tax=Candidatus Liptonbacteria bacterium RIFCSPLOWO2_01_FULL_45_15 TaxID=1798649 RepID=A0A1G2CGX0_9BACT|nr:MAG: hypothetical protein A3B13_01320 [Candidatus Liptonbacteria bacterium RIFCSPLOWO2_01_FULL_45_15]